MNLFRTSVTLLLLAMVSARAESTAPTKLGSAVWDWDKFVVKPTAVGTRRDVVDLPTATLAKFESHISTLNPGKMSHPPHQHLQEEFIILKEGTLDVSINGQVTRVHAGSMFLFASNDWHNVTNVGDTPATYLVFNLTTGATKSAPAEGAAKAALPGKMGSTIVEWEKLKVETRPNGERRELFNSPTVTCANLEGHVTTLNKGEVPHAPHRHPDEELVIVKEGIVEATIDGVAQRGGPGSIFFYGSNSLHGMKNVGPDRATYYVFRIVTDATPQEEKKAEKKS